MNELMKKHKAAVAQVPRPGVPATPCMGTVPWSSLQVPVTVPACPGPLSGAERLEFGAHGKSCFGTLSFSRPPGTWLR